MCKFVTKFINSKFVFVVYLHYMDCNIGQGAPPHTLGVVVTPQV